MSVARLHYLCLSYPLSGSTPRPAGLPAAAIEQSARMPADISNVFNVRLCNHVGTHIDGPNHFNPAQPPLCEWPIDTFVFHRLTLLELPKRDAELITADDLRNAPAPIESSEFLLLRTGYGTVRRADPKRYQSFSPGFSAAAAEYLIEHLPMVRAIGIDTLSLACPQHLDDGIRAHRVLMCNAPRPLFAIEDMNLQHDLTGLRSLYALPLWCDQLDSGPCTVLAELSP